MYEKAILRMGHQVVELRGASVYNEVIRTCTDASFRIEPSDDRDAVRTKIANFCAHAHFLELRIARSLEFHLDACMRAGRDAIAKTVESVLADEERHQRYTLAAVHELVDGRTAGAILDVHRRGERRANLEFSQRQVRAFLDRFPRASPRRTMLAYRVCAGLMEGAAHHV